MKRFLLTVLLLALPGCSYLGLGAQAVKNTMPEGQQLGTFKVGNPYQIQGTWYYPQESYSYDETGIASWYGPGFHGGRTANGERYSQHEMTAAHRTLQMPSFVRVTNLSNGRSVVVRVNDRGPFAKGRIIDVSSQAADLLGFKANGTARVRVQVLPEASRQVAQAAREGRNWHGDLPDEQVASAAAPQLPPAASPQTASYLPPPTADASSSGMASAPRPYEIDGQPVPAHTIGGNYYPDPVVTQRAVPDKTSLYIQAGSFSDMANAQKLIRTLGADARAYVAQAQVRGTVYHRVRVGPFSSVPEADRALSRISAKAPDARIIVE